jgi:hypothetical protein
VNTIFIYIFCGWGIGLTGYIILNKMEKYNNMTYYNLSDKVIKYKRIKDKTNIHKKN